MSTNYTAKELERLINTILLPAYNAIYHPKTFFTLDMLMVIHKHNNSAALLKKPVNPKSKIYKENDEQNIQRCSLTS